ncbi:MAG: imidazolonepropionase [Planctomycetota bacterium]|nr:MAG: imidazolonepropionase [Planctomycetota bacterium]
MRTVDLIIDDIGTLVTLAGPPGPRSGAELGTVRSVPGAAIAIQDGEVVAAGPRREIVDRYRARRVHDAQGRLALPGFVDAHTHLVYARERIEEWEMRLAGADYVQIAEQGGGIRASVRQLRAASHAELLAGALARLDRMLASGTTTVEIKSGYGLSLEHERKSLEVIAALDRAHPIHCVPTFLGAHEVPDEYRHDRAGYVRLVIDQMLPALAPLARFCDVFCEAHVFDVAQARAILLAGRRHGLLPKLHADELAPTGGAELAAELGATSADHLVAVSEEGIRRLAAAGVIAVLLPGTCYFLRLGRRAPARAMVEAGVALALATDSNPGTSPTTSMPLVMSLACQELGLRPAEALVAATVNAACAIGEGARRGSLEPGKRADVLLCDAEDWRALPYHFGTNLVAQVFIGGELVWDEGRRVQPAGSTP